MRPIVAVLLLASLAVTEEKSPSGFDFKKNTEVRRAIDINEVLPGTRAVSPKDAIPAVWKPKIITPKEANWLGDDDRVLGVVVGKEARAYPLFLLETHEMVNDVLGGKAIAPNY